MAAHDKREERRAARVLIAKLALVLVLACVFFVAPFIPWSTHG